jgi:putative flippase GtrA
VWPQAYGRSAAQLFRYGLVGIASNLSGYLLFLLITYWGMGPKIAVTLLYVVGATIGFFGNRQWAFAHNGALLRSGATYFVAHVLGYMINLFMLFILVDRLGYSHRWVQAGAVIVVAGFLFVVFKYLVFPETKSSGSDSE